MKNKLKISSIIILSALLISSCAQSNDIPLEQKLTNVQTQKPVQESDPPQIETQTQETDPEPEQTQLVLYDNGGILMYATGFNQTLFGNSLKVIIENNSDKNIKVQIKNSSINECMVSNMFSCDVLQGKKASDEIVFLGLSDLGITDIYNIGFSIKIMDENYEDIAISDPLMLLLNGENSYNYEVDDTGLLTYDDSGIQIVAKSYNCSEKYLHLKIFAGNLSGKDITIRTEDESINGFMAEPLFSVDVASGKYAIKEIDFPISPEMGNLKELEFKYKISEQGDYFNYIISDQITIDISGN